jgi:hypothetical protein
MSTYLVNYTFEDGDTWTAGGPDGFTTKREAAAHIARTIRARARKRKPVVSAAIVAVPQRPAGYRNSAVGTWLDSFGNAESVFTINGSTEPPF